VVNIVKWLFGYAWAERGPDRRIARNGKGADHGKFGAYLRALFVDQLPTGEWQWVPRRVARRGDVLRLRGAAQAS